MRLDEEDIRRIAGVREVDEQETSGEKQAFLIRATTSARTAGQICREIDGLGCEPRIIGELQGDTIIEATTRSYGL